MASSRPRRSSDRPTGSAGPRTPRADARRNVEAILDAGERCLGRDPEATVADIAREAGVGRVTVYGHFPTRAELVDAIFRRVVERAGADLDSVDTGAEPRTALIELISSSWEVVHRYRMVLAAAERELPGNRIIDHHDPHRERLAALLTRGREAGVFRTDLSIDWLSTVFFILVHAAAGEVGAGRLSADQAPTVIIGTLLSAYAPPAAEIQPSPASP
jgi:AcrR family transcriptional regulator